MPARREEIAERLAVFPRERTYLLPALLAAQEELGWLPDWAIELVGAHLRVPKSEVYGIASSFPDLLLREPAPRSVTVCTGAACRLAGAGRLKAGLEGSGTACIETECLFVCALAPAARIDGRIVGRASPEALRG